MGIAPDGSGDPAPEAMVIEDKSDMELTESQDLKVRYECVMFSLMSFFIHSGMQSVNRWIQTVYGFMIQTTCFKVSSTLVFN